ncbi:histidine kinase [Bacillus lacus]|uniref:histidine kinase n=1 Tax=Metabacillus lacus TaxID=1983721 RepID=A0A7X2J1B2_9BACI|nr:histidine kinase [Metabacillus lacus]MRX73570.1 histidine kinase [Metabacillus lacus]
MKKYYNKIFAGILIISLAIVLHISILSIKYPFIGANVKITDEGEVVVTEIDPNVWAAKAGVKIGDRILKINGSPAVEHFPTTNYGVLEQVFSLRLDHNGSAQNIYVQDSIISHQGLFLNIIPLTFFILCLFCIYFIYKTNKKLKLDSAFLLNLFLLTIGLAYLTSLGSARGDLFSRYVNLTLFLLVPVLYLHFIYQYFLELGKKLFNKNYILIGYFIVFSNLTIEIFSNNLYSLNKAINLGSFFVLIILTFVLKILGLKKVRYSEQEYFVKVIIITNVMAFSPFLLLYVLPYLIFNKTYIFSPTILASFLLLIPFSLVYQFIATKIYDIEFILGRVKYYSLLAVIPTFFCVGLILLLKDGSENPTYYTVKLLILIYLTMVAVFYFKEILDYRFRLKRFSEKYNYQDSIFKYTQSIRKATNLSQVIAELKKTITDVLLVTEVHFIEYEKVKYRAINNIVLTDTEFQHYENEINKAVEEIGKVIELDKGFVLNVGETEDKSYILLCLSMLNTPRLTRDEISWLKTLSFYTNVSLENFLKIEELMHHLEKIEKEGTNPAWLTKLLFSIEEKQRSNLAKDLHDSVLQDLISLKRKNELALAEFHHSPEQLGAYLEDMNENMTKIIKTTRETCQELRPQLLYDLGLVKALNKLVAQYQESASFAIRLNAGKFSINVDIDTQLNLYRIVQELLNNAYKHSHAQDVLIMLVCIKDKIVLHYEDDGVGYDQENISFNTETMGLSGISERVKALKGTMVIETSVGSGFKVVIEL